MHAAHLFKQNRLFHFSFSSIIILASSVETLNFRFGKMGKRTGKPQGKKQEKKMEEEKEASSRCHIECWHDPWIYFFFQFLLHSMLIPHLTFKFTLILQIIMGVEQLGPSSVSTLSVMANVCGPMDVHFVNSPICTLQPKTAGYN